MKNLSTVLFCIIYFNIFTQVTPGSPNNFITEWNTLGTTSITIPTSAGVAYNYDLYWEEIGNPGNNGNLLNQTGNAIITGLTAGVGYQVEITGDFPRIYFDNITSERNKIIKLIQWGSINWLSMESAFYGCGNLDITANDNPDLSNVNSFYQIFKNCHSLTGVLANWNWDLSNVSSMEEAFCGASNFNKDIGGWDVSSVTIMKGMFDGANSFNKDIGDWNVSNVVDMNGVFRDASSFNQDIGGWDVSSVVSMKGMFDGANSFNQDVGDWDVSNVVDMSEMFRYATAFNNDISVWNVSSVVSMKNMFRNATVFNQDIRTWDVSAVTNMFAMFSNSSSFNQDLGGWDISGVNNLSFMLSYSGMDCVSYSNTLIGWGENSLTPNDILLSSNGLIYNYSAFSIREEMIEDKGWNIVGDAFISEKPSFPFNDTIFLCKGESVPVLLTTSDNDITGQWSPSSIDNLNDGLYLFSPNPSECSLNDTLVVIITDSESCSTIIDSNLIISNGVSPNNDGLNDYFEIKNLEAYAENKLSIFNRWGDIVYKSSPYENDWNGQKNLNGLGGSMLPAGVYYYVLELGEKNEVVKGYIELKR